MSKVNTVNDLLNKIDEKNFYHIRCHNEKGGMFYATTQGIEIDHENKIVEFYSALATGTYSDSNMIVEIIKEYKDYELKIYGTDNKRHSIEDSKKVKGYNDESLYLYVNQQDLQ